MCVCVVGIKLCCQRSSVSSWLNVCVCVCVDAGISLIYFLCLVFAIYQKYDDVTNVMYWLYPDLRDWKPDDKVNASDKLSCLLS